MTNFENFKKEILETGFEKFAYDRTKCKTGECGKISCEKCEFNAGNYHYKYENCYESKINWLDESYLDLTQPEIELIRMLQDGNLTKYDDKTIVFENAVTGKTFYIPTQAYPFEGINNGTSIVIIDNEIDSIYQVVKINENIE